MVVPGDYRRNDIEGLRCGSVTDRQGGHEGERLSLFADIDRFDIYTLRKAARRDRAERSTPLAPSCAAEIAVGFFAPQVRAETVLIESRRRALHLGMWHATPAGGNLPRHWRSPVRASLEKRQSLKHSPFICCRSARWQLAGNVLRWQILQMPKAKSTTEGRKVMSEPCAWRQRFDLF